MPFSNSYSMILKNTVNVSCACMYSYTDVCDGMYVYVFECLFVFVCMYRNVCVFSVCTCVCACILCASACLCLSICQK